eukprot:2906438-Pleurochrysis_carterae.AAC.2
MVLQRMNDNVGQFEIHSCNRDVAKPLVQVSGRAFVALRLASTQRTAEHAGAENEEGELCPGSAPSPEERRHE